MRAVFLFFSPPLGGGGWHGVAVTEGVLYTIKKHPLTRYAGAPSSKGEP